MRNMIKTQAPWVSDVPEGWRSIRNKFLLSGAYSGGTPKSSVNVFYSETGLPFISIADMSSVDFVNSTEKHVTEEGRKDKNLQIVPRGSIIYSMYATVGHVAETNIDATISQAIIALYIKDGYDKAYYKYNLRAVKDYIFGSAEGTTQMNLNAQKVYELYLMQPPIEEQKAIVSFLDNKCAAIDEAIERHKKVIEKLEEYKQAQFSYEVTHSDCSIEMKPSETYAKTIPAHWKEANLGSIVWNMRNGYVGPTRDILVEDGVRYIQSLHIKNGKILFERGRFYVSEEWGKEHPKIKTGDLLIVQTGDIGQVAVVTDEYNDCNCHALIIARTRIDIVDPEYLACYFRSKIGLTELLLTSTGATLQHLNSGLIKFSKVILPPLNEQKTIVNYLHKIEREITEAQLKHEAVISKLQEYRKSLIYHAVTGKIDCREAV